MALWLARLFIAVHTLRQTPQVNTILNLKRRTMAVYQSNPVGVKLFSYVNTFVGFVLHSLRTEIYI